MFQLEQTLTQNTTVQLLEKISFTELFYISIRKRAVFSNGFLALSLQMFGKKKKKMDDDRVFQTAA